MNRLGWRLAAETLLIALVIAGAAVLLWQLPLIPGERSLAWEAASGAESVSGTVRPARSGINQVDVRAPSGAAIEIQFVPVGGGALIAQRTLNEVESGRYLAGGLALTRPGPWQMLVALEQPDSPATYVTVDWNLGPDGALRPAGEPVPWEAHIVGWLNAHGMRALTAGALVLAAWWSWRVWRAVPPEWRRTWLWWIAPALVGLAVLVYLTLVFIL